MKRIKLIAVLAFMFLLLISLNSVVKADTNYGNVSLLTQGATIKGNGTDDVELEYGSVTLQWEPANASLGRNRNGYWIGYQMNAPADIVTNAETAQKVTYKTRTVTNSNWSVVKSFYDNRDGEWYLNLWVYVDQTILDAHDEEFILGQSQFDWTGDGSYVQTVSITIDPEQVTLTPGENMATITIRQRGNNASSQDTVFTAEKGKTLAQSLGSSEKTILANIQAKEGFVNFYKMDIGESFDATKIDTYQEFDPESDIIEEDNVTIVAYINIETTPEPDPVVPEPTEEPKDDSPKTGNVDIIGYVLVIAVVSATGIFILRKKH